ncbi:hypothetical protein [Xenorhabdus siamensis]
MHDGWCYLATVIDLFSCRVVGMAIPLHRMQSWVQSIK